MASTIECAPTVFINASPKPEQTAPPIPFSTYNPEPIIGESPTRPCILNASPLVVLATAISPFESSAIIEIVSWFSMLIFGAKFFSLSHSSHFAFCYLSRGKPCTVKPYCLAKYSAPYPTSMTWGVVSMTLCASCAGWATPLTKATEPALPLSFIKAASRVTMPSRSGHPPRPTVR